MSEKPDKLDKSDKSEITLKKAINKLSAKKNVVTETAKQAKKNLDHSSESLNIPPGQHGQFQKNVSTIHVFNDSVRLLTTIFQKSHFSKVLPHVWHASTRVNTRA